MGTCFWIKDQPFAVFFINLPKNLEKDHTIIASSPVEFVAAFNTQPCRHKTVNDDLILDELIHNFHSEHFTSDKIN